MRMLKKASSFLTRLDPRLTLYQAGTLPQEKVGRSSLVERLLMVRWVVGWIPHGGPIELFLISASAPQLI